MSTATPFSIDDVLRHGANVPAIPRVVGELMASFRREDCDADYIARLVSADPALSAKVLKLANSAFYRRAREVVSVRAATVIIGYVALRLLVASFGMAGAVRLPPGMDGKKFWRYCLHTGVVARYLASRCGVDPEIAFSAGLLHAVGHPAIGLAMPEQWSALEREAPFYARDRALRERKRWGFDHALVGGRLAETWSFPPALAQAIRYGAEPLAAEEYSPVATVVRVAADIIAARELGLSQTHANVTLLDPRLVQLLKVAAAVEELPPIQELAAGLESLL